MDDQPAQRGAALARRAHGGEGDGAQRPDRDRPRARRWRRCCRRARGSRGRSARRAAGRRRGPWRSSRWPRRRRRAGSSTSASPSVAAADQHARTGPRARRRNGAMARSNSGLDGKRGQRRLLRRLPHHGVAADQRERGVPGPHRDRKIEGRDDAADAQRMPRLHHAVVGALGGDGQAVELARQADGEVADVDHLLDFAEPLRHDLAGLEGHQPAEIVLGGAQFLAEQAYELAAPRRRHRAPGLKCLRGPADGGARLLQAGDADMGDAFARDRRRRGKPLASKCTVRHSEPGQDGERLVAHRYAFGEGRAGHRAAPPKRCWGGVSGLA